MATAKQIAARKLFSKRAKAGDFVRNPKARKSIKRPSQITNRAPTKRLVKRRKTTERAQAKGVRGMFANPKARHVTHMAVLSKPSRGIANFHFAASEPANAARCWSLPASLVSNGNFQAWARGNSYVVADTLAGIKGRLRKLAGMHK